VILKSDHIPSASIAHRGIRLSGEVQHQECQANKCLNA
jgi:hypothetical protein